MDRNLARCRLAYRDIPKGREVFDETRSEPLPGHFFFLATAFFFAGAFFFAAVFAFAAAFFTMLPS
jgi:hypothetical protein